MFSAVAFSFFPLCFRRAFSICPMSIESRPESTPSQVEVGGYAAGPVDGFDLDGEILGDALGGFGNANFLFRWSCDGHLVVRPSQNNGGRSVVAARAAAVEGL